MKETPGFAMDRESLEKILGSFRGPQKQTPPMYSALKKNGVPLYQLARKGITVAREPREITIHEISLLNLIPPDTIEIRVRCSSGTYIRSLAEELGGKEGHGATMAALCREKIGHYSLADASPGEDLKKMSQDELWSAARKGDGA